MDFLVKTKGGSTPKAKPRVYFTCHPEDFEKYIDKVCDDIFKTHDCAIYYTENMYDDIEEENKETDLGQMNLFVIPVTFKLLIQPNRAMDSDFAYAAQRNIPVLPIMMESGLDSIYARPDKFGERQYLTPFSEDLSEITYEEKLKKYLESVLISDETATKVRAAFDAYIFLSYRKKDRRYANELMKLIHSHPECRDIAIWYDEFLTPGESFNENIGRMLNDSKLFALLVTPNLLEDNNFVMENEYPAAKNTGIDILPAEMEQTDKDLLKEKFSDIPDCVDPYDDESFKERLKISLSKIAKTENDKDSMHNFLIGLAYLDGIDVEVNVERALELISFAANADLPEAMKKLYDMYDNGKYVKLDYNEALKWIKKLAEYRITTLGEEHPDTLTSLNNLAVTYSALGDYQKALELKEKVYTLRCKVSGEEHPDTLTSLSNLASTYGDFGEHQKALELKEKVYALRCKILGEEHPDALTSFNNLAVTYRKIGNYQKAFGLIEKVYALCCKVHGEEHPDTLTSLNNLAATYGKLGDHRKALALNEKVYALRCKVLGEEHPDTLLSLGNLATTCYYLGDHQKAFALNEKVYDLRCKVFGEEHPDTLISLGNLATTYSDLGNHRKALELKEKVYALRCKILGEEHPDTLVSLGNLAITYGDLGNHQKALALKEKVYTLHCKILGEEHPDTLISLGNLATTYGDLGDHRKALALNEKVYSLRCKVSGEEHPSTLISLNNLAVTCYTLGYAKRASDLFFDLQVLNIKIFGKEHPKTEKSLDNFIKCKNTVYDIEKKIGKIKRRYSIEKLLYGKTASILRNY